MYIEKFKGKNENLLIQNWRENTAFCTCGYRGTANNYLDKCPACHSVHTFHRIYEDLSVMVFDIIDLKTHSFSINIIKYDVHPTFLREGFQKIIEDISVNNHKNIKINYDYFSTPKLTVNIDGIEIKKKTEKYKYLANISVEDIGEDNLFNFVKIILNSSSMINIIKTLEKYPELEILYNTYGLNPFFETVNIEDIKKGYTKPNQILGISKNLLRISLQQQLCYEFSYMQQLYQKYINKPDIAEKYILDIYRNNIPEDRYFKLINDYHYNREKMMKYLTDDIYTFQGIDSPREGIQLLCDYINMCEDMEVPFEKYPTSLKKVHDVAVKNHKVKENEILQKKFHEAVSLNEYKKLEDVVSDYLIQAPSDISDVVNEGKMLHHCVASYVQHIADRNTKILFMRHKTMPSNSLITLEIREDRINQYKGAYNRNPSPKEMDAINLYAKKHNLKIA